MGARGGGPGPLAPGEKEDKSEARSERNRGQESESLPKPL